MEILASLISIVLAGFERPYLGIVKPDLLDVFGLEKTTAPVQCEPR